MLFSIVYYVLSVVLYILALPLLLPLTFKQKYKHSIPARFFLFKNKPFDVVDGVWFHVCSLGEARALQPLVESFEKGKIAISTITHTGWSEAQKYKVDVRYLPFEIFLPFWVKKQQLLVVLEAEFWYMLFTIAHSRGAKIVLLNARISDKSVQSYLRFGWFYKKMLLRVEKIFAQSEVDKNRFLALGARNVEVVGNIKLASKINHTQEYKKPDGRLIVAGSTHDGEERLCLDAFAHYKGNTQGVVRCIIVPRHPERFGEVERLMQEYAKRFGWSFSKFSKEKSFSSDLILCDMMGELNNIYNIADIAILGGAFKADVGGHNPLEPAHFGCKIITGEHFFHQKELFKYVHHVQYVKEDAKALCEALEKTETLPPSMVEEKIELQKVIEYLQNSIKGKQ